jgi:hypothetical protein
MQMGVAVERVVAWGGSDFTKSDGVKLTAAPLSRPIIRDARVPGAPPAAGW